MIFARLQKENENLYEPLSCSAEYQVAEQRGVQFGEKFGDWDVTGLCISLFLRLQHSIVSDLTPTTKNTNYNMDVGQRHVT